MEFCLSCAEFQDKLIRITRELYTAQCLCTGNKNGSGS